MLMDSASVKSQRDRFDKPQHILINTVFLREFERRKFQDARLGGNIMSKMKMPKCGVVLQLYDMTNRIINIKLSIFSFVFQLKHFIAKKVCTKEPSSIRVFFRNYELSDAKKTLTFYGIKNQSKVYFIAKSKSKKKHLSTKKSKKNKTLTLVRYFGCIPKNNKTKSLLLNVRGGLKKGFAPELAMNGTGGTYFLKDKNKKKCAVFKPVDEEPYAPNNPRVYAAEIGSPSFRPGLFSGGGASREVAAYLLDRGGFSGVPVTTMIEFRNCPGFNSNGRLRKKSNKNGENLYKIGSLQQLAHCTETAADYGTKRFDTEEVHKIGILDLRTINLDRNDENILIRARERDDHLSFIPIDHGYCLPSSLEVERHDWVWLDWPQVREPFSQKSLNYIRSLRIRKDIEVLKSLGIEEEAILVFCIVNTLLKKAALAGLTLYQIARIVMRSNKNKPSKLEIIVIQSLALYFKTKKNSCHHSFKNQRPTSKSFPTTESVIDEKSKTLPDDKDIKNYIEHKEAIRPLSKLLFARQPRRSQSRMDLDPISKNYPGNCFLAAKRLLHPRKKDWRRFSNLDVSEKFSESKWLSEYAQSIADSAFMAGAEAFMDFAIYQAVLSKKHQSSSI